MFLETQRLILRPLAYDDFDDLSDMLEDYDVMYEWEHTFTFNQINHWIDNQIISYGTHGYGYLAAIRKSDNQMVGQVGLLHEQLFDQDEIAVGFLLKKQHWGNGYATEAAAACIQYAFETLHADRVICPIRPENEPSIRVATRLGMAAEREFTKRYNGKQMRHILFAIPAPEKNQ